MFSTRSISLSCEGRAQAHPDGQDHRPEVTLSPIVPTAFIESWKERLQTGLVQSEDVILSGFTEWW